MRQVVNANLRLDLDKRGSYSFYIPAVLGSAILPGGSSIMLDKVTTLLLCSVLTACAGTMPVEQTTGQLRFPIPTWTGGIATCEILQRIMEAEYGYSFKQFKMPHGAEIAEALVDGDLDFECEVWPSYASFNNQYVKKFGGDGRLTYVSETGIVGVNGYFVPRYVIEGDTARGIPASAPDLKSYKDLNQYKHIFHSPESGERGNLIACPIAAWACEDQQRMDSRGVDFYAQALGSETAHWAEIQAKYKRGEPFIAYAWAPHWIHAALDLIEVELPVEAAWPDDVTYFLGTPKFVDENPEMVQIMKKMNLTNKMQAKIIYEIDVRKRDKDKVIEEWMATNRDVWRQWLP
jgi:glycine betaine/proline transport system substrate-binding protein